MAIWDHHYPVASPSENQCALQFCLTWVGFFAAIGAVSWIISTL